MDKKVMMDEETNPQSEERKPDPKEEGDLTDPDDPRTEYSKTVEEPEDNDGENRNVKPEDRTSVQGTVITIVKAMVGCGILNLPYIFKTLGIIPATFILCLTVGTATLSIHFLMKCKDITQRYGYSMYAKLCFGTFGTFFIKFAIVMLTFGGSCIFLRIFGDVFYSLVSLLLPENLPKDSFYLSKNFYVIVIFFVIMPLMFKEDITALKKFSFIGVLSIFIFLVAMVIVFFYKLFNNEIEAFSASMLWPNGTKIQMFTATTALMDSFTFQMNTFPIYLPLKPRTSKNMVKATFISTLIAWVMYFVTGILGFAMYRDRLNDVILGYFKEDIIVYKKQNIIISGILFISIAAYFISALLTMPIMFFALKKNLITLIGFVEKKFKKKATNKDIEENTTLQATMVNTQVVMASVQGVKKFLITLITYVVTLLCTLCVTKIIVINNIVGSTVTNMITMISPATFYLLLEKSKNSCCNKIIARIIFIYGFTILTTFITIEVRKAIGI
jgi:amino acid permease